MRGYCRGLLLFKLGRYAEAKGELTSQLGVALDHGDNQAIIRLGAAFAYLYAEEVDRARGELDHIEGIGDLFAEHLVAILRLHLAVAQSDQRAIQLYVGRLANAGSFNAMIGQAASSLLSGDISNAFELEANLLLAVSPELRTAA